VRVLQAVVIGMGVVLVGGFTYLFVTWGRGVFKPRPAPERAEVAGAADAVVAIPPNTRVVQVAPGGPFLDVLVENPDGTRDLYQVRRADGTVAGTLRFRPAAP
jgi:hypothetical protein